MKDVPCWGGSPSPIPMPSWLCVNPEDMCTSIWYLLCPPLGVVLCWSYSLCRRRCIGNTFPIHLCLVTMRYCNWSLWAPSLSLQPPVVDALEFSQVRAPVGLSFLCLCLPCLLLSGGWTPWHILWGYYSPQCIYILLLWFVWPQLWTWLPSPPTNANHGYPTFHLPSPFMHLTPFYPQGFPVPQSPVLPPQAQRYQPVLTDGSSSSLPVAQSSQAIPPTLFSDASTEFSGFLPMLEAPRSSP